MKWFIVVFYFITIIHPQINIDKLDFVGLNNSLHSFDKERFIEILNKNPSLVNLPAISIDNIDNKNKTRYIEMEKNFTGLDKATVGKRWTVLQWAAFYNLTDLISPILSKRAQINYLDIYKKNIAHIAARWGQDLELIKQILLSGVKLNQVDFHGDSPLHILARRNLSEKKKIAMMELLFRNGANFKKNNRGISILNIVVKKNDLLVLNYLIKKFPFLLKERDREGNNALHWAASSSDEKMFLLNLKLFDNRINLKNYNGWTPVHWAVKNRNLKVLETIAKIKTANFEAKTNKGNTPLHLAVDGNEIEAVKLLLKKRVNLNAQNRAGNTPLHIIAKNNYITLAKAFVKLKAKKNIKNKKGELPIDLAQTREMRKILME